MQSVGVGGLKQLERPLAENDAVVILERTV